MSVTDNVIEDIKRKGSSSELISTWKFGCPPDPRQVGLSTRRLLFAACCTFTKKDVNRGMSSLAAC